MIGKGEGEGEMAEEGEGEGEMAGEGEGEGEMTTGENEPAVEDEESGMADAQREADMEVNGVGGEEEEEGGLPNSSPVKAKCRKKGSTPRKRRHSEGKEGDVEVREKEDGECLPGYKKTRRRLCHRREREVGVDTEAERMGVEMNGEGERERGEEGEKHPQNSSLVEVKRTRNASSHVKMRKTLRSGSQAVPRSKKRASFALHKNTVHQ